MAEVESELRELLDSIDRTAVLDAWTALCREDAVLAAVEELNSDLTTVDSVLDACYEPFGFEEEIRELAVAADEILSRAGAAGLASRELMALCEAISIRVTSTREVRIEFDRRLRIVLGRALLYVNVAALKALDYQTRRDALTGLRNKVAFAEDLDGLVDRGGQLVVAMIDVDGLKQINDNDGHAAGDDLLRRVAAALAEACVAGDYAYRWAGDEYAFLSTVRSSDELDEVLEGLSTETTPFSWGVASCPSDAQSPEELTDLADARMYERKQDRKRC
ncbi:GGDEF domain-containing protein [Actinospongicola halichondriae]|uniref:GGDEF domain-containing protein n=1 Tax=Actinospongicola halichondriae TaxID=3236844 RepID=UPI003D4A0BF7